MSIFKKTEAPPAKPRERTAPPPRGIPAEGAISIIGAGMTVVGDIDTEGIVRIEGSVEGTIRAGKSVVLGQSGVVIGNIITEDAVIGGTITGSVVAGTRLELQSTCSVNGEIRTRAEHLKLEEGARFAGKVQMIEEGETPFEAADRIDSSVVAGAAPTPVAAPVILRNEAVHDRGQAAPPAAEPPPASDAPTTDEPSATAESPNEEGSEVVDQADEGEESSRKKADTKR